MNRVKNGLFWFACGLVVISAVRIFGPEIETRLFPVYSKFEIHSIESVSPTQTRVVFEFQKLRQCEPRSASWADDELGQEYKIILEGDPNLVPRDLGQQLSRPRLFDASVDEVENRLVAYIVSRCPFMPWDTRSEVFP